MAAFYSAEGPLALTWFYQVPAGNAADAPSELYVGSPQVNTEAVIVASPMIALPQLMNSGPGYSLPFIHKDADPSSRSEIAMKILHCIS